MAATDLHHLAIKTNDVDATVRFWNEVVGSHSVDRPDFPFPGAWLQFGTTMIHLYGGDAARNDDGEFDRGSAAIDHVALAAEGFDEMRDLLIERKLGWRQLAIPSFNIWQLFVYDPNGVLVELNFYSAREPHGSKGPDGTNLYDAGRF
jgi:catechol 2,3-dioxygenase-like lactoylglutathione lyase family enzyme